MADLVDSDADAFADLSDHDPAGAQYATDAGAGAVLGSDLKLPSNLRAGPALDDGFESVFQQLFERLRTEPDGVRPDEQATPESSRASQNQPQSAEQLFDLLDVALRAADEDPANAAARAQLLQPAAVSDMSAASPTGTASADAAHAASGSNEARAAMAALDEFEHKLGLPLAEFGALGAGGAPDPGGTDTTAAAVAVVDAAAEAAVTTEAQRSNRGGSVDDGAGSGGGNSGGGSMSGAIFGDALK